MINEAIIIFLVIIVVIIVWFGIWFFAFRDEGGNVGSSCSTSSHCQRGLECVNAECANQNS
jgi:hypothetical protein